MNTIFGVSRAAYTVFMVPEHDSSIYKDVATQLRNQPQPLQLSLNRQVAAIKKSVVRTRYQPRVHPKELLGFMGVLMQFMSYLPKLHPYCMTPFADTEKLYKEIVRQGQKAPLNFSEQLNIALRQTEGDLPEALWRLFITSRLYARWFDTDVIIDMPDLTRDEIMHRMQAWSRSLAACKAYGSCPDQDVSGDTYYCWTHALAKVLYNVLPARRALLVRLEAYALHNGTKLNHGLAHKFKAQRLPSDHTIAANYGNAIGVRCVEKMRGK